MITKRPQPPRPDRIRSIHGSFSWIDHRFLRQGFDEGLTRLEKLLYFLLVAVSNQDGVSFYSDQRLGELLDIRFAHELTGARDELVARHLIAFQGRIYQVLELPCRPRTQMNAVCKSKPLPEKTPPRVSTLPRPAGRRWHQDRDGNWKSLRQLLGVQNTEDEERG